MVGGASVGVASGVCVAGAGVEDGSPAGTVSVGIGSGELVIVGATVQIGLPGGIVGVDGAAGVGVNRGATSVISVTITVPQTPISAAMMAGSILDLGVLDILVPVVEKFSLFYAIFEVYSSAGYFFMLCAICLSILPIG